MEIKTNFPFGSFCNWLTKYHVMRKRATERTKSLFFHCPHRVKLRSICYLGLACVFLTTNTCTVVKQSRKSYTNLEAVKTIPSARGMQERAHTMSKYSHTWISPVHYKAHAADCAIPYITMQCSLWYSDRLVTCELGFVYFLSDLAVWAANPQALNNPNVFLKHLCPLPKK